jgi:hypothetical protein
MASRFPCSSRWSISIQEGIEVELREAELQPGQTGRVLVATTRSTGPGLRAEADTENKVVSIRSSGSAWKIRLPEGVMITRDPGGALLVDTGDDSIDLVALVEPNSAQIAFMKAPPPPDTDLATTKLRSFEPSGTAS